MKTDINKFINPPPADGCCMICGRHEGELEDFLKAAEFLPEDCRTTKLAKSFRYVGETSEPDPFYEQILKDLDSNKPTSEIEALYKKEELEAATEYEIHRNYVYASWECKECYYQDSGFVPADLDTNISVVNIKGPGVDKTLFVEIPKQALKNRAGDLPPEELKAKIHF